MIDIDFCSFPLNFKFPQNKANKTIVGHLTLFLLMQNGSRDSGYLICEILTCNPQLGF